MEEEVLKGDEFETTRKDLRAVIIWCLSRDATHSIYGQNLISDFVLHHLDGKKGLDEYIKDNKLKAGYTAEQFDDIQAKLEKDRGCCIRYTKEAVKSIIKYWDLPGAEERRRQQAAKNASKTPVKLMTEDDFNAAKQSLSTKSKSRSDDGFDNNNDVALNLEESFSPVPKTDRVCTICYAEIASADIKHLPCMHCFHLKCALQYVDSQLKKNEATKCPTCSFAFKAVKLGLAEDVEEYQEEGRVQRIHPEVSETESECEPEPEDSEGEDEEDIANSHYAPVHLPQEGHTMDLKTETLDLLLSSGFLSAGNAVFLPFPSNQEWFREHGLTICATEDECERIISIPPFNSVSSFVETCVNAQKPFAVLVSTMYLTSHSFIALLRTHSFKVLVSHHPEWLVFEPEAFAKSGILEYVFP
jgi:hypothetical protein